MPVGPLTSGALPVNIEELKNIQTDLQRTARDLDSVSKSLAGHLLYMQYATNGRDASDVTSQMEKLQASADQLRDVAQRLDC
jgi:hypothetical protein